MQPPFAPKPPHCPSKTLNSLSFSILRQRVSVHSLEMLAVDLVGPAQTHYSEFPQWEGRGYFKIVFSPSWHPVPPNTWSLARKPIPLRMGVGRAVNKEPEKVSSVPTPHISSHIAMVGEWQGDGNNGNL